MSNKRAKKQSANAQQVRSKDGRKDTWGWVLAGIAIILYANTLGHGYAFDDGLVITQNSFTLQGLAGIPDLLTTDFFQGIYGKDGMELTGGRYRPLSLVMFAIEYQLFGLNPFIGHLINVLFYGCTALLMYKVLHQWFSSAKQKSILPFLATMLFVVHPIHTEVVANIKSRDEIVSFLLLLAVFFCIDKYHNQKNKLRWMSMATGAFFLSMLAKETAFTFVLLIPLALFVIKKYPLSKVVKTSIPFWIAAILYYALRTYMVGGLGEGVNPDIMENPFVGASFVEKYATISVILLKYLGLLFFPHPLSCDYSFNQIPWTTFADFKAIFGFVIYLMMAVWTLIKIPERHVLAFCIPLFFIPLSLTTNILFNIGAPMADRFLYMPSFGFCLAVGFLIAHYFPVKDLTAFKQNIPLAIGLAIIFLLGVGKTISRNMAWKDNLTLFGADVKTVPASAKIHYYYANANLAEYLSRENTSSKAAEELALAERHFAKAVEINPKFHTAMYNLGLVAEKQLDGKKAEHFLLKTLELVPRHVLSHKLLAEVYARFLNQPDKALYHLDKLIREAGLKTADNYQLQGVVYGMKQDFTNASLAFENALKINPNDARSLFNYGITLNQMGDQSKAQQYLNRAYELDPSLRQ
jgi:Flp pilus assembly protein TadD